MKAKGKWTYLYRVIDEHGRTLDFYLSQTRNTKDAKRFLGKLRSDVIHRQVKYLNNRIESDHGKLKMLIKPMRGFQSMKTAYATIKGFEVMHMFRKKQFNIWMYGNRNEVSFINELFEVYN